MNKPSKPEIKPEKTVTESDKAAQAKARRVAAKVAKVRSLLGRGEPLPEWAER